MFITSDEIVFATHLQMHTTLQMNTFVAGDKWVLCWGQALLALETNVFHTGDEHFSAGDECVETHV